MNMVIDLDKLFEYTQRQVERATSVEDIEDVMEDCKKYLCISFSIKED